MNETCVSQTLSVQRNNKLEVERPLEKTILILSGQRSGGTTMIVDRGLNLVLYALTNPNLFSSSSGDESSCDEDNRNNRNDNGNGVDDEGKTFLKHSMYSQSKSD